MLDGHEINEIKYSAIFSDVANCFRLDSHFFEKKYKKILATINKYPTFSLKDIVCKEIQTGHTPSMKNPHFYNGNIALIKTDNVREGYIDSNYNDYITELGNKQISRTTLQENDIITTIIGASDKVIARSAIIQKEHLPCNINQNIVQIRVDREKVSPFYVYFYLNSFYGKNYLYYYSRQTEQVNLNCKEVSSVRIPCFSKEFQSIFDDLFFESQEAVKKAEKKYKSAEELLNNELNINQIENTKNYSIRSLSASFDKSKRLDAEYYDEKYDSLLNSLNSYDSNLKTLNDIATYVFTGEYADNYIKTKSKDNVYYIRGTNINKGYIEVDDDYCVNKENFSKLLSSNDILTGRVGTIGNFGVVDEKLTNCVCSDNVLCFHLPSEYDPNVYALYLNSNCVKQLTI